tara:strand:- start:1500 stop:2165 length:666 start_codon:yes stop_codon:yes gene_type:complete
MKKAAYLFWTIGLAHVFFQYTHQEVWISFTKPLLMPLLAIFYCQKNSKKIFLVALLFSWVGDLLLMGEGYLFFLSGILSFWVAQLLYLYFINKEIELPLNKFFSSKKGLVSLLLFGGYFLGTISLLGSKLGTLTIPVSGYAFTLATIGAVAMLLWMTKKNTKTFALLAGVVLFILSDSMIAFNTFYFKENIFGFWVMATYIPAQFLICNYFINQSAKQHEI